MIGPHHSSICCFTATGHGASACTADPQTRQVEPESLRLGQVQHPDEHGGDELGVGHAVALDQPEALCGVEVLHDHDRGPEAEHRHGVDERSQWYSGAGDRYTDAGPAHVRPTARCRCPAPARRTVAHRGEGERLADPLGWTRRSRRIEHLPALALIVDGRHRERRHRGLGIRRIPGSMVTDSRTGTRVRSRVVTTSAMAGEVTRAVAPQSSRMYCTSAGGEGDC